MPPAVCSAECKFVAISPFSQSLIWKRARSASAGRAFPVFRKAHCAFTHIRKPPGTVCRLDALQLQTLSIRTGGRSPRLAFSPVSSGASQASYGAAGSGTRLPNGARSLSRRRNANASSSAQPVRPVRSLQVQPSRTAHDARENLKVLVIQHWTAAHGMRCRSADTSGRRIKSTKRSAAAILGRSAPSLRFMVRFGIFCCR